MSNEPNTERFFSRNQAGQYGAARPPQMAQRRGMPPRDVVSDFETDFIESEGEGAFREDMSRDPSYPRDRIAQSTHSQHHHTRPQSHVRPQTGYPGQEAGRQHQQQHSRPPISVAPASSGPPETRASTSARTQPYEQHHQQKVEAPRMGNTPATSVSLTPSGAYNTPWGGSVINYRNFILFTEGLRYRTMLQWVFHVKDVIRTRDSTRVFCSIPEEAISMALHGVTLDGGGKGGRPSGSSAKGVFQTRGADGFKNGPTELLPGVSLPMNPPREGAGVSTEHVGMKMAMCRTKSNGTVTHEKYEIRNSLTPAEQDLLEKGRNNHQLQILQISLESYSNPLPFPLGILWRSNQSAHMTYAGDEAYMFVLQPNTNMELPSPLVINLRDKLDVEDAKMGAMYERDKHDGMTLSSDNDPFGDKYVYTDTLLYYNIKHFNRDKEFPVSQLSNGKTVVLVPHSIVASAERNLETVSSVKFIGYKDFSFELVPALPITSFSNMSTQQTKDGILEQLMKQKNLPLDMLQQVSVGVLFNYL